MDFHNVPGLYYAARLTYGIVLILFVISCALNLVPTWVAEIGLYAYVGFLAYVYAKVRNDERRRYRINIGLLIAIMVIISFAPLYITDLAK